MDESQTTDNMWRLLCETFHVLVHTEGSLEVSSEA